MDIGRYRSAEHGVAPEFVERWSPRAFTDETIPDEVLLACFEAARWAPSSMNAQPWRFLYAKRGAPTWPRFVEVLQERPRVWAPSAAALVVFVADTLLEVGGQLVPSPTAAFDTGAAAENFSLQANRLGWHTHGIASFRRDVIGTTLGIPERFTALAIFAIGRVGPADSLPSPFREREFPSGRRSLAELAMEGGWHG
jgi:nitroreductase